MTHPMPLTWMACSMRAMAEQERRELERQRKYIERRLIALDKFDQLAEQLQDRIYNEQQSAGTAFPNRVETATESGAESPAE